jgi:hypothetical protein
MKTSAANEHDLQNNQKNPSKTELEAYFKHGQPLNQICTYARLAWTNELNAFIGKET